MKKIRNIVICLCTVFMICLTGCGPKAAPNTETDIQISYWKAGLGVDFLNDTIAAFEEEFPQYNVILETTSNKLAILDTIELGADYNSVDLYMTDSISPTYHQYLEPLNDVVERTNPGESKTIGQKYFQDVLANLKSKDNNYYSLSYGGGWGGMVYNSTLIDGVQYKVPRTTDELESLAMQLYDDGIVPFMHFQEGGYWFLLYQMWQIQYDGLDYYRNTYVPLSLNGSSPSKEVLTKADGRRQVLDVMESIVTPDYVYNGANAETFTSAQTLFVKGQAAMMVNGSWLLNEMSRELEPGVELKLMKTPVISSIVDVLPDKSISRSELGAIIDAIDAAGSAEEVPLSGVGYECTEADRNRVYEARNLMFSNIGEHSFYLPKYSVAKDAVKEFIAFFYRDENMRNYADTLHATLPLHYSDGSALDMSDWNDWEKEVVALFDKNIPIFKSNPNFSPIFTAGGADDYARVPFVVLFCSRENDRINAATAWNRIVQTFEDQWPNYLANAGIQ